MKKQQKHLLLVLSLILTLLIPLIAPIHVDAAANNLKIHYIDVGESDCTLIQYGSKYMMIDAGDTDDHDTVLSYLKSQKVKKLEYLILTHPHADHIGSAADVIEKYSIDKIIMPAVQHTTQTYEDVLTAIADKKMKITKPVVGTCYSLGDASFTILAPNHYDYGSNINNYSISIKLTYKNHHFMFIGDAETEAIEDILNNGYDLSADVYMCGHHGSDTSTTKELLKAISPDYAIISVGKNSYGHPEDSVLKMLSKAKIETHRTDKSGTIVLTSTGKHISFNTTPSSDSKKGETKKSTSLATSDSKKNTSEANVAYVYVTKTGIKYHQAGCRYLKDSMIKIKLKDAKKQGYEPCSVCN